MSPSSWGPPTWVFIHTLAEKIKVESFPLIGPKLIMIIIQICNNLPCPDCAAHSREFWSKVIIPKITSKTDLIILLFLFHNVVNRRKKTPPFKYIDMQYYRSLKLIETYNVFSRNFNTKGNMNLLNESFHRKLMLAKLREWLMANLSHFIVN